MTKRLLIIFLFALLLISLFITIPNKIENDHEVNSSNLIIAVYPTSSFDETYLFEILPCGNIHISQGTRKNINISCDDLKLNKHKKYNQHPKTECLIRLHKAINNIIETNYYLNYRESYDSWDIAIICNDKIYKINLDRRKKCVKELIDIISEISPVKIDIHDWS